MPTRTVVSHDEWIEARKALLAEEKEFTRLRDELSRKRRKLPWEKVTKDYDFDGPNGKETLADLFDGRSQLIVYHFMLGPGWEEGCKSCSFLADHFDPAIVHLNHRDVSMVAVSKAPLDEIAPFKKRMGWSFKWVSSSGNDFNRDYHVSFSREELNSSKAYYNYRRTSFPSTEAPGASVFCKDENGQVFHTYSVYERGLDMFIVAYHYLDIVPKGRDESARRTVNGRLRALRTSAQGKNRVRRPSDASTAAAETHRSRASDSIQSMKAFTRGRPALRSGHTSQ